MPKTGVGRNAPCPCGSGKKYKKCCMAKDEEASPRGPVDPLAHEGHAHERVGTLMVPADLSPEEAEAYVERLDRWSNAAEDALERGRLDEVERLSARLIAEYPDQIDGYRVRAQVRERKGQWSEAKGAYEAAVGVIEANRSGFDQSVLNEMRAACDAVARRAAEQPTTPHDALPP